MKFLKKLKSSNFWVSMISAVVLILQAVFNVDIKTEYLNQIILGILGLLVMSGIVTDTPNGEVTVSQSLDLDGVKESLNNMFTQISSTIKTDITNIVSQFEKVNSTQDKSADVKQEDVNAIQPVVEAKQDNVSAIQKVVNQEEVKQVVIETADIVETNETDLQNIDVPKNEL